MIKAYSYIRMSRPEQLRGDSLRRQLEAAQTWATKRGVELDDSLRDIGISAYRGKNRDEGALRRFLDLVESGEVARGSYLIVESLDRISREAVLEALPRFIDLIKAGVVIVTLSDGQEYSAKRLRSDWTPLILSLAVMARAHEESRMKGERVGAAWAEKRKHATEKPLTARVPAWLRLVNSRIELIPERAKIVRRIFEMTASGLGKRMVAIALNSEGVAAFQSRRGWHTSYITKILDNRATLGECQPHRLVEGRRVPEGDPVPGYYPAIVSEDLFLRARAARQRRTSAPGRRGIEFANLLQGLAHCRMCGARMVMLNKGIPPKGGRYLACSAQMRHAGCQNDRRWRYDRVEAAVLDGITRLDFTAALDGNQGDDGGSRLTDLRAALGDAERKRDRWARLIDDGDELAADRFRSASADVRRLKKEIAATEGATAQRTADGPLSKRAATVRELHAALSDATSTERRDVRARLAEALRRFLEKVEFSENGVRAVYRVGEAPTSRLTPFPALPIIIDEHPESVAARAEDIEAGREDQERESARAKKALARLPARGRGKAKRVTGTSRR